MNKSRVGDMNESKTNSYNRSLFYTFGDWDDLKLKSPGERTMIEEVNYKE